MKKIATLAAMLAATGFTTSANAYDSGGFVRAEVGNTTFETDTALGSDESDDTSFALRGGYYFSPFFGVEGFYSRYADTDEDGVEATMHGFGAGVMGKYNFGPDYDGFYVSGRAGIARITSDVSVSGLGSSDASDTTPYFGVGVGYDFSYNMGVGVHYDIASPSYEVAGDDLELDLETASISFEYRF